MYEHKVFVQMNYLSTIFICFRDVFVFRDASLQTSHRSCSSVCVCVCWLAALLQKRVSCAGVSVSWYVLIHTHTLTRVEQLASSSFALYQHCFVEKI